MSYWIWLWFIIYKYFFMQETLLCLLFKHYLDYCYRIDSLKYPECDIILRLHHSPLVITYITCINMQSQHPDSVKYWSLLLYKTCMAKKKTDSTSGLFDFIFLHCENVCMSCKGNTYFFMAMPEKLCILVNKTYTLWSWLFVMYCV